MAEVAGVVASGISIGTLAAQITSSLIKLQSYWDQVRDAPEEVRDLLEELRDLSNVIADIEADQQQNPMSGAILNSTSTCLRHCKEGADRLKELVDSLQVKLEASSKFKRKWGLAKVVLKKDQIDKYKASLERAIRLLSLSHQVCMRIYYELLPLP